jgi:hypothetical protein
VAGDEAGEPLPEPPAPQTWYRMHFSVPKSDPRIWAPWKIHSTPLATASSTSTATRSAATGSAARSATSTCRSAGSKFGEGEQNVLSMNLRPVDGEASLRAAELSVYADQAEVRE